MIKNQAKKQILQLKNKTRKTRKKSGNKTRKKTENVENTVAEKKRNKEHLIGKDDSTGQQDKNVVTSQKKDTSVKTNKNQIKN